MTGVLRLGAFLVVALGGWTGASGLAGLGAGGVFARIPLPWDADGLGPGASEARVLLLRPGDAGARFRDACERAQGPDGDAFRRAARALVRYARVEAWYCLDAGQIALDRWRARGEPADLDLAADLLRAHLERSTDDTAPALRAWIDEDALAPQVGRLLAGLPRERWAPAAVVLAARRPDVAWPVLTNRLLGATRFVPEDARAVGAWLRLARGRGEEGASAARRLASSPDLPPSIRSEVDAALRDLGGGK